METIELKQTQKAWDSIAQGYDIYVTSLHDENFTKRLLKHAGLKRRE